MSLFYTFYGEADVSSEDLRSRMASVLGGSIGADGTIFRDGMNVAANRVEPQEAHATTGYFGFQDKITAIFHFSNRASAETTDHNTVLMAEAVLATLDAFPGRGVLLFNGEQAILQRLGDGIEFDAEWEDWTDIDEARPMVARHVVRRLAQPLL
ncbi:SitI3 family protein [Krasilnikovia sp. MM14-A1004]|uniref:SitI3 family protein n=1 Tax=Krasilnikovia sp. MM14-A1004 TaxID=3373541 RepID=UPI00399CC671